ncbi:hypothetical protein [Pedobacter sp. SYSU D00535]|uniref:hypothetical protein n=1 Tax=Pedobacter sp. SYSU D00535 TaxID=2810308 RepID=UPI001A95E17D|nr:hypothetical protein [Pedobacter sp. SYSU D00535]
MLTKEETKAIQENVREQIIRINENIVNSEAEVREKSIHAHDNLNNDEPKAEKD